MISTRRTKVLKNVVDTGSYEQDYSPQNWREGCRLRAWELHEQGWKQKHIAEALGVTEGAVSQWFKKAKTAGTESLRHHPAPGLTARMSGEQLTQLSSELSKGPEAFGFRGQVWTTARVVQMILQVFGIRYHPLIVAVSFVNSSTVSKSPPRRPRNAMKPRSKSGKKNSGRS